MEVKSDLSTSMRNTILTLESVNEPDRWIRPLEDKTKGTSTTIEREDMNRWKLIQKSRERGAKRKFYGRVLWIAEN